jgi:4-hydroxybenzoate polyprenyltransferase
MRHVIEWFDSFSFSPTQILGGVLGIIFVRTFVENFSNPEPTGLFSPIEIMLNYSTFYVVLFLCFVLLLYVLTQKKILSLVNTVFVGFFIIIIPPLIDLALSGGKGFCMGYIGESGVDLINKFFLFFFQNPLFCGATPGIKIEAVIVMVSLFVYTVYTTKLLWKGALAAFGGYSLVFIFGAFPGIIGTIAGIETPHVLDYLQQTLSASSLATTHHLATILSYVPSLLEQTSLLLARIQWISMVILLGIVWRIASHSTWSAWWMGSLKKIPLALTYLGTALIGGAGIAFLSGNVLVPNWIDALGILIFLVSLFLGCWTVSITNDIQDISVDKQVNPERPLATGTLTLEHVKTLRIFTLILSNTGMLLINYNVAFCFILFQIAYTLHSSSFQLKRHWTSSALCIFFAAFGIEMAGYFLMSQNQAFSHFPLFVGLMFPVLFLILNPLKDISDIEGDRSHSIRTLPVLIGTRATVWVTAGLVILWGIIFHNILSWVIVTLVTIETILLVFSYEKVRRFPSKGTILGIILITILGYVVLSLIGSLVLW